jgi:hypothetical protein
MMLYPYDEEGRVLVEGGTAPNLRAIQRALGVPVSESIRRAIDQYLKQRAKKK